MSDIQEVAEESDATYVRFGEIIKKHRLKAGLTQAKLSALLAQNGLDMRQNTITKLEQGARPTNLRECIILAEALDMEPAELFRQAFPTSGHSTQAQKLRAKEAQLDRELDEIEAQIQKLTSKANELQVRKNQLITELWNVQNDLAGLQSGDDGDD